MIHVENVNDGEDIVDEIIHTCVYETSRHEKGHAHGNADVSWSSSW